MCLRVCVLLCVPEREWRVTSARCMSASGAAPPGQRSRCRQARHMGESMPCESTGFEQAQLARAPLCGLCGRPHHAAAAASSGHCPLRHSVGCEWTAIRTWVGSARCGSLWSRLVSGRHHRPPPLPASPPSGSARAALMLETMRRHGRCSPLLPPPGAHRRRCVPPPQTSLCPRYRARWMCGAGGAPGPSSSPPTRPATRLAARCGPTRRRSAGGRRRLRRPVSRGVVRGRPGPTRLVVCLLATPAGLCPRRMLERAPEGVHHLFVSYSGAGAAPGRLHGRWPCMRC